MATTIEQIQQLVQEIGPSMQEIDAVVQTEEPSWAIQFSDETILVIEAADDPSRMVLSAELGMVTEAQQRSAYETMLCYNLLWRDSGGVKVGLAGPQGALIVSREICLDNLTLAVLQQEISAFMKITRSWMQYIVQVDQGEPTPLPGMSAAGMHLQV